MRSIIIFLLLCSPSFAGPKEAVAVAYSTMWAKAHMLPHIQNDFSSRPRALAAADGSAVAPPSALEPTNGSGLSEHPAFDHAVKTVAERMQQQLDKSGSGGLYPTEAGGMVAQAGLIRIDIQKPAQAWSTAPYTTTTIVAPWCHYCHEQKSENGDGNAQVSHIYLDESAIQDEEMRLVWRKHNGNIPITFWRNNRGTLIYIVGKVDTATILKKILRNDPPTQEQLSASQAGAAGSVHGKSQIAQVVSWWRSNLGEGVICRFRWDRTGATSFPLLAKGDWSCLAIFGKFGHFQLSADNSQLPVDSIGFGYKVDGSDVTIDLDAVTLQGLAARIGVEKLSGPNASAQGLPSPPQIGVLTVLSIMSIVNNVISILNPSCDLQLGGSVEATAKLDGDVIVCEFSQCPKVCLKMLFTFLLGVERVEISETQVRVIFSGSRWIRERTFQVQ